ncbi:MAG: ABC transporter permease, partial [Tannerellaceae bacterium]|nr:ABC transporter permease [Tannerellaceae bacterium]
MEMFDFPVILGDPYCLDEPEKVMIPESLAIKLFGEENPIGKQILTEEDIWLKWVKEFTVGAVFKDLPGNTQLRNGIYMAIAKNADAGRWLSRNYAIYVMLDSPESVQLVTDNFNHNFDFSQATGDMSNPEEMAVKLIPLTDIYFKENLDSDWVVRTGSRETVILLICIALFIIIIAAINFTNFSTALTPLRIKSINTQKVLGSPDRILRISLLCEAVLISFISALLAVALVNVLDKTSLLTFIDTDIRISNNWIVVAIALGLS